MGINVCLIWVRTQKTTLILVYFSFLFFWLKKCDFNELEETNLTVHSQCNENNSTVVVYETVIFRNSFKTKLPHSPKFALSSIFQLHKSNGASGWHQCKASLKQTVLICGWIPSLHIGSGIFTLGWKFFRRPSSLKERLPSPPGWRITDTK